MYSSSSTRMESRFNNPFVSEQEDAFPVPDGGDSPPFSGAISDGKLANISSPKRSRRALQRRVISVPIGDADGSRLKGEGAPPSDSWAWRKYGQKPIKGSPYPRGYYRCSSSKGCPARKQVERSRADPTMLVITYACEHNHPWPTAKSSTNPSAATTPTSKPSPEEEAHPSVPVFSNRPEIMVDSSTHDDHESQLFAAHFCEDSAALIGFTWFSDMAGTSPTMLESPLCGGGSNSNSNSNDSSTTREELMFAMGEEDESLFADLGELPECSVVFRRAFMEKEEEERRRCSLRAASWCETSG